MRRNGQCHGIAGCHAEHLFILGKHSGNSEFRRFQVGHVQVSVASETDAVARILFNQIFRVGLHQLLGGFYVSGGSVRLYHCFVACTDFFQLFLTEYNAISGYEFRFIVLWLYMLFPLFAKRKQTLCVFGQLLFVLQNHPKNGSGLHPFLFGVNGQGQVSQLLCSV